MNVQSTRNDLERFRAAIAHRIGLQFDDTKLGFLSEVLHRRLERLTSSSADYLWRLEEGRVQSELRALAQELTVNETYFFRHNDQFRAFADVALPERMRAREATRTLNVLSAGCASGEEAYSLAIVARQTIVDPSWNIQIRAIDLNPFVLEKAARGRYSPWALRDVPEDVRARWFRSERRELILGDDLRGAVKFDEGNLASDDPTLWPSSVYDVIFCRNVLMYFAPDQMRAAVARITTSLAPGGYLFLGHAETLRGISDAFHLCHTHDTFYYCRKERIPPTECRSTLDVEGRKAPPASAMAPSTAFTTAWVDTIRQASDRVVALVTQTSPKRTAKRTRWADWDLAPALELLRHERFGEALDHVRGGPPEAENDPDVLLVKAVLLVQAGQLSTAETVCWRLLEIDELNAGAHYVLALCNEHKGNNERALEHDRVAAHLDPAFAMPRLHCGLLMRQTSDRGSARRELAQALVLLKREDVSRLLLFGGGFTRNALIALCQSAAAECGGRA